MPTKDAIRQEFMARRMALSDAEWQRRSQAVAQHVITAFDWQGPEVAHLFIPLLDRRELDTWHLIRSLWTKNITVVVPVSDFQTKTMRSARLQPNTPLTKKKYGLLEPTAPEWIADEEITWVGVPLLAISKQGHRLGYGGGFYDRFLATLAPTVRSLGLSLETPVKELPGVENHDIPVQGCVNPEGLVWF